jgi:hypothetical protein
MPPKRSIIMDQPNLNSIPSSKIVHFKQEVEEATTTPTQPSPSIMSIQDHANLDQLSSAIKDLLQDDTELSTPVVAKAAGEQLEVEFGEATNSIPIGADFMDPLVPEDYDAYYHSEVVNW